MVKYGFYSSENGDRSYAADDLNSFLEGLVSHGIFKNVGDGMRVERINSTVVRVRNGKCWFKEKYTRVVDYVEIGLPDFPPVSVQNFYVVVEVNSNAQDRINRIRTAATLNSNMLPLAKVNRSADGQVVSVTDLRGTPECPWIAGLLANFTANDIINSIRNPSFFDAVYEKTEECVDAAIADELYKFNDLRNDMTNRFDDLYMRKNEELTELYNTNNTRFNALYNTNNTRFNSLYTSNQTRFDSLYDFNENRLNEKYEEIDDRVTDEITKVLEGLPAVMVDVLIRDSDREYILDSNGKVVEASVQLLLKWW